MATPKKPIGPPASGPRRGVIIWRLIWTWLQTLLGFAVMGGLVAGAFLLFGLHWSWGVGLLSLWMVIPIIAWFYSAKMVKRLTGCKAPDPHNPDHVRLVEIVDRLYPKTGLSRKPPVFISPIKVPNAFATGRTPGQAFIACTEGLFLVGLNDAELEGVIAHELAHVKHFDVAMNSLLAALGSLFSILLAAGLPRWFHPSTFSSGSPLLDKLSNRVRAGKQRFFLPVGGFLGFVVMLVIFYIVSAFTKFISLFVARARESAADAQAAYWTGNPCALSTALQKIVIWVTLHAADLREGTITRGITPLTIVNALTEGEPDSTGGGIGTRLRRWWQRLGENHPPVADRVKTLERMNGGKCPRVRP